MGEATATPRLTRNHAATKRRSHAIDLRVFMVDKYMEPNLAVIDFGHALQAVRRPIPCTPVYIMGGSCCVAQQHPTGTL
jgi:hypothetical protein